MLAIAEEKVFDTFAEALAVDPDAQFTFASNSGLSGQAASLQRLADRLRDVSPEAGPAGMTAGEQKARDALAAAMDETLLKRVSIDALLTRVRFDLPPTEDELRATAIGHSSTALRVPYDEAESTYHLFIGWLVEAMAERRYIPRRGIDEMLGRAALQAQAWKGIGREAG